MKNLTKKDAVLAVRLIQNKPIITAEIKVQITQQLERWRELMLY